MNAEAIKNRVKKTIEESVKLKEKIDELEEWSSFDEIIKNIGLIIEFVVTVIMEIERTVMDISAELKDLSSSDKLEAAVSLIDDFITLPFWLEIIDGPAIKILISTVVYFLNDKYGNVWPLDK